jgi:hypothetical protein
MAVRTMDRSVATPGGAVRSIRDGPPRPTSTARSYGRRHETGPDPPGPGRGLGSTASSISPSPPASPGHLPASQTSYPQET